MGNEREILGVLKRSITFTARSGIVPLAVALLLATFITDLAANMNQTAEVPNADAGRGPCTVDFLITDSSNQKPLPGAWTYVKIRHGFLGMRKIELQVPTNAAGRARITGLSYKTRKEPLAFRVRHGDDYKIVYHYPK